MSKQEIAIKIGLFAAGAGVGFGVGYSITKKRAEARADSEIASVKERYSILKAKDAYATPTDLAMERGSAIAKNIINAQEAKNEVLTDEEASEHPEVLTESQAIAYNKVPLEKPDIHTVIQNNSYGGDLSPVAVDKSIFDADPGTDPAEVVMPDRDKENPYIISVDTFMNDEDDFNHERIQLTYWEGSDTLSGDDDSIMDDVNRMIGDENLIKFGLGSKDKNIVYVRNEKIGADYEIVRDERSYYEVVLGAPRDDEPKQTLQRMREGD